MSSGLSYLVPLSLKPPNAVVLNILFVQEPCDSPQDYTAKCFWYWRDRENTVVHVFVLEKGRETHASRVQVLYLVYYYFFAAKAFLCAR